MDPYSSTVKQYIFSVEHQQPSSNSDLFSPLLVDSAEVASFSSAVCPKPYSIIISFALGTAEATTEAITIAIAIFTSIAIVVATPISTGLPQRLGLNPLN